MSEQSQPNRGGRPSRYSANLAAVICWNLTAGKSLRAICREPEMPDQVTVFRWVEKYEEFRKQYARARELQAHVIADETWQIVDEARGGTTEEIQAARLRFDQRRWMAGKLLPKVYGDKLLHTGADGESPVGVKLSLDYTLLSAGELLQLKRLIEKATPKVEASAREPLQIEGEVVGEQDSNGEGAGN